MADIGDIINDYDTTDAMIRYGGSFVHGLGKLYRQADHINKSRLRKAFPEYFEKYEAIAKLKPGKNENVLKEDE